MATARRGRPSKPTTLKILHGDDKKNPQRINRTEPHPATGDVVAPPDLPKRARTVWDRLAPDLIAKGVLTAWDVELFAHFCRAVPIATDAWADIETNGTSCTTPVRELIDGTIVYELRKNPAWQVAREATAVMATLGGRFGMTPSDRAQLKVGSSDHDPGEDLLSG